MTDRIDLDDLDVTDENDEERPNRGDWFWRGEGTPDDESVDPASGGAHGATPAAGTAGDSDADSTSGGALPGVPRPDGDKPVGVPRSRGGAGGAAAADRRPEGETAAESPEETRPAGGGPHGGGVDDMTIAFTFEALNRLEKPRAALADAEGWTDWIGIVGDVDAHVINKFQRDRGIDADFFNGTGSGPAERLAAIDEHSMFYAKRAVVVGVDGERWIAEGADWEFVPLSEAADAADWDLTADAGGGNDGDDAGSESGSESDVV